jgi:hypothetical protein
MNKGLVAGVFLVLSCTLASAGTHIEYALFQEIDRAKVDKEFHERPKEISLTTKLESSGAYHITYEKEKYLRVNWERTSGGAYKIDSSIFDGKEGDYFKGELRRNEEGYLIVPFKKKTLVIRIVDWDK